MEDKEKMERHEEKGRLAMEENNSFAPFSNLKCFVKIAEFFADFWQNVRKCCQNFAECLLNFDQFFSGFSKMQH